MSTFHSDMEQNLGLLVCFCKIPMCFYREGKWTFSELGFISLVTKKDNAWAVFLTAPACTHKMPPAVPEDSFGPCWWLQRCSSSESHQTCCPLALAKLCGVTKESCQTDMRCWMQPNISQIGEGENMWAASSPPHKDCMVCRSCLGAWKPASSEMTVDGDKGRAAAGSKVMCFVGTPVNSHMDPKTSKWRVPTPERLIVGWHCSDVETQWDRRWRDTSQRQSGSCCLHSADIVFSWACCCCMGTPLGQGHQFQKLLCIFGQVVEESCLTASKPARGALYLHK